MSQSPLFQSAIHVRLCLPAFITSLLVLPAASLAAQLPDDDSPLLSNRHVSVICELNENEPAGTLITRLQDHHLTLKNFRAAGSVPDPVFSVDPHDGSVRIDRDDQIDFEAHQSLRFRVSADEGPTERDRFLDQFSAGLLEDGLTTGAIELMSSSTVTFDITVRLIDVQEPPSLSDVSLLVQVFDESPAEIGTVAAAGRESSEGLHYFIISGNEDDFFQINTDTGVLSLRGSDALQYDMFSTHELQILAENSAGLSATSNVIVSAFNETPGILAVSTSDTTRSPDSDVAVALSHPEPGPSVESTVLHTELPFGLTLKLHYEPETRVPLILVQSDDLNSTPSGDIADQTGAVNTDAWPVVPHLATPIPSTGPIDTMELREWLTATNNTRQPDADDTNSQSAATTKSEQNPASPSATVTSESQNNVLQSLVALIVFVVSCVGAAVALSRASSARRRNLEDEVATLTQSQTEDKLSVNDVEAEQEAEFDRAAVQSKHSAAPVVENQDSETIAALSKRISLLQSELATRDHLIADLRAQLRRVCEGLDTRNTGDDESAVDHIVTSGNHFKATVVNEVPPMRSGNSLSQILQHVESRASVCSGLTAAQEAPELELTSRAESPSAWGKIDQTKTVCSPVPEDSTVATLSEVDDLRSELAELFISRENPTVPISKNPAAPMTEDPAANPDNEEDTHLDTVKQYLSRLLDRSKDSTSPEDILVDRRKNEGQDRGTNRRSASEPARKPVKSFLESYMSTHGGELSGITGDSFSQTSVEKSDEPSLVVKPRTPVDVQSVRESMNSFRAVAIKSVENAVLSHDLRLSKGAIAGRTVILAGLILLTTVAFLASRLEVIQSRLLPWLMAAIAVFAMVELGVRVHGMRKQRRGLASGTMTSAMRPKKQKIKEQDLDDTLVES